MSVILGYNDFIKVQQQPKFYSLCKYSDIQNIHMKGCETESRVEVFFDDPFQEFLFKIVWMYVLL
jgi:hypothetical protein